MTICRLGLCALICCCLIGGPACRADSLAATAAEAFSLRGFGTLGVARSDSDSAEYVRDLAQPRGLTRRWSVKTDSLLGVQGKLAVDRETAAVVQVISRNRYDGSYRPEG